MTYTSSTKAIIQGLVLTQSEQSRHQGISLVPHLDPVESREPPLPRLWVSVKLEDEWMDSLPVRHLLDSAHHCPTRYQVKSSHSVDRQHCGSGCQCVVERLGLLSMVFATRRRTTSPSTVPRTPPLGFCSPVICPTRNTARISLEMLTWAKD